MKVSRIVLITIVFVGTLNFIFDFNEIQKTTSFFIMAAFIIGLMAGELLTQKVGKNDIKKDMRDLEERVADIGGPYIYEIGMSVLSVDHTTGFENGIVVDRKCNYHDFQLHEESKVCIVRTNKYSVFDGKQSVWVEQKQIIKDTRK